MRRVALLLLAGVTCHTALADTVVLDHGDRLSGELQELTHRRLVIETHYAPEIEIEWRAVHTLESDGLFTVWLEDGGRLVGSLQAVGEGGVLVVAGDEPVFVARDEIVRFYPTADAETGFWERLEMDVDVGLALTRGNALLNQSYFGLDTKYRRDSYEIQWDTSSIHTEQSEVDDISRQMTRLQTDFFVGDSLFSFVVTGLERDVNQRLDLRANLGGGLGWHTVQKDDFELAVLVGSI